MRVQRINVFRADKKLDGRGTSIAGLIPSAIYDGMSTKLARFFLCDGMRRHGRRRIAARNMTRPAIAANQLFQRLSGRTTSAAPAKPRTMRKAVHEEGLWRICRSLGVL